MVIAVKAWLPYGDESTFGTKSSSVNKTFGHGLKITSLSRKNNPEKVFGLGNRDSKASAAKQFEGDITVEGVLSNPWWFYNGIGTKAVSGSDPYTHTFALADTLTSFSIGLDVDTATETVTHLLGCQINTWTITAAVNELAKFKLDIQYVDEALTTSAINDVDETFDLFTFAHGSIDLPSGTTLAEVQNVELTYTNNNERIFGLGSRTATELPAKNLDINATVNMAFQNATLLKTFYGTSSSTSPEDTDFTELATMVLTFTNGLGGSSERSITMTFTKVTIGEENLPLDPTALFFEDLSLSIRGVTNVVAVNSTSARP